MLLSGEALLAFSFATNLFDKLAKVGTLQIDKILNVIKLHRQCTRPRYKERRCVAGQLFRFPLSSPLSRCELKHQLNLKGAASRLCFHWPLCGNRHHRYFTHCIAHTLHITLTLCSNRWRHSWTPLGTSHCGIPVLIGF